MVNEPVLSFKKMLPFGFYVFKISAKISSEWSNPESGDIVPDSTTSNFDFSCWARKEQKGESLEGKRKDQEYLLAHVGLQKWEKGTTILTTLFNSLTLKIRRQFLKVLLNR